MSWITALLSVMTGIIDRLPSRKEALLNQIQDAKDEIKKLQNKTSTWTTLDSGQYYVLTDKLQSLEKRASNL